MGIKSKSSRNSTTSAKPSHKTYKPSGKPTELNVKIPTDSEFQYALKAFMTNWPGCKFATDALSEEFVKAEHSDVAIAILNYFNVTANRNVSMQEYNAAEHDALQHLADIMSNYIDGELINFGDGVREGVALKYLKHYAPFTCKDYVDPRGGICHKISQQNACIKAVIINMAKVFAEMLVKHGQIKLNSMCLTKSRSMTCRL